jgi:hypothetical protein
MTTTESRVGTFELDAYHTHDGQPQGWKLVLVLETVEQAREFVAAAPKSLKLRATTLTGPINDAYENGSREWGYVTTDAALLKDGVNGGVNETGIKRYWSLKKWAAKAGVELVWTRQWANSYATQADFEAALS